MAFEYKSLEDRRREAEARENYDLNRKGEQVEDIIGQYIKSAEETRAKAARLENGITEQQKRLSELVSKGYKTRAIRYAEEEARNAEMHQKHLEAEALRAAEHQRRQAEAEAARTAEVASIKIQPSKLPCPVCGERVNSSPTGEIAKYHKKRDGRYCLTGGPETWRVYLRAGIVLTEEAARELAETGSEQIVQDTADALTNSASGSRDRFPDEYDPGRVSSAGDLG